MRTLGDRKIQRLQPVYALHGERLGRIAGIRRGLILFPACGEAYGHYDDGKQRQNSFYRRIAYLSLYPVYYIIPHHAE